MLKIVFLCQRANAEPDYSGQPIPAAVNSRYSVSVKKVDLPSPKLFSPGTIEVKGAIPSFVIKFNSASSKVNLFHQHQSEKVPQPKESFSEDAPQILRHEVSKPIIQEVHEIISPYRRIVQEIKPVIETIDTIISKSSGESKQSAKARLTPSSKVVESLPLAYENETFQTTKTENPINENLEEINEPIPDLILDQSNLIDNSLYNGNSELDLKYVSPNGKTVSLIASNEYEPKLYKDR